MSMALNDVLKKLEAVEANVEKLTRLWAEISAMLPSVNLGMSAVIEGVSDEERYRDRARVFKHIAQELPAIDGFRLEYSLMEPEEILSTHFDVTEVMELSTGLSFNNLLRQQGEQLDEYRFRLGVKRRQLARQNIPDLVREIDRRLEHLKQVAVNIEERAPMPPEEWEPLRHACGAINTLLGSSFAHPKRWGDLLRHLHFGIRLDFDDIVRVDWPSVKPELQKELYADDDPLPVDVDDIGELVAANPKGDVITELKWADLKPDEFERLLFNLIASTPGYENPEWLTHTHAPDDGRDLSAYRVYEDKLSGAVRHRVIIACKHWMSRSVDFNEVTLLRGQMTLWEPPRVDCLVIATSGRFTTQAVRGIEKHNQSDSALKIEMWPGTHFEWLLAQRPALIAEFGLR